MNNKKRHGFPGFLPLRMTCKFTFTHVFMNDYNRSMHAALCVTITTTKILFLGYIYNINLAPTDKALCFYTCSIALVLLPQISWF